MLRSQFRIEGILPGGGGRSLALDMRAFVREFGKRERAAAVAAAKGEAYRLFVETRAAFDKGIAPKRAGLTQEAAKTSRGNSAALRHIQGQVAYRVVEIGKTVEAIIGPADVGLSGKINPITVASLELLYKGGPHEVTREMQQWLAYKLRRRMGEPVINPKAARGYGKGWHGKRQRIAAGRRKWREIPAGRIPKVGRLLHWPGRPWAERVINAQRRNTEHNLPALMAVAMQGERWPRLWWDASGRFAGWVKA